MKVLFVTPNMSSFTKVDVEILKSEYDVQISIYDWTKKWKIPFYLIHQFFQLLKKRKEITKIVVSFGGYWALIPSYLGKRWNIPVYIIIHGTDASCLPSVQYGGFNKKSLKKIYRFGYRRATLLLPVSQSLIHTENNYYEVKEERFQGIKHFLSDEIFPFEVIHNGIDSKFWKQDESIERQSKSFISVFSKKQFTLKGGDLIIEMAKRHSDCTFYIAGVDSAPSNMATTSNVKFLGYLKPDELHYYYNVSQYHFQLSIFEGFGCALVEAMMCGCIPIVSSSNILPMIIDDTGFVLEKRNADLLSEIIQNVLSLSREELMKLSIAANARAVEEFNIDRRKKSLLSAIK